MGKGGRRCLCLCGRASICTYISPPAVPFCEILPHSIHNKVQVPQFKEFCPAAAVYKVHNELALSYFVCYWILLLHFTMFAYFPNGLFAYLGRVMASLVLPEQQTEVTQEEACPRPRKGTFVRP